MLAVCAVCLGINLSNSFSQNAACSNNLCNLAADGAYEHFIIGELVYVASDGI